MEALLVELFDMDELRRWMHTYFPQELIHELPGEAASCAVMTHEAVGLLRRHGLIDDSFFDSLVEARAQRRGEIDAVRALQARAAASRPLILRQGGSKQTWERRHRVAFRWTFALSVAGIMVHGYPWLDASRLLEAQRNGIFSFVPTFHRPWIFPALTVIAAACTLLFWLLSLRQQHLKKDER